jgi:FAD/FMN-containing dehydrogenase
MYDAGGRVVNDVHSQLNPTRVARIARPTSLDGLCAAIGHAATRGEAVSVAGGRHAMGGQQFAGRGVLIDASGLDRVLAFDRQAGTIDVEAGIQWPKLIAHLHARQPDGAGGPAWGIAQKQTGADRLGLGGALAANVHGRGLTMKPFVGDVESFVLVGPDGRPRTCSRAENPDLFRLAVGGYGLFGAVYSVKLRLAPRRKLRRVVIEAGAGELPDAFESRIADGFLYGDFQFAIDPRSDEFLRRGVFSCYEPVPDDTPMPREVRELGPADWCNLIRLAHTDKAAAYRRYADHYRATSGQLYWSDLHQLSTYIDDYHAALDLHAPGRRASEVITELYAPRHLLPEFLRHLATELRRSRADVIYGTVRLIERDDETFLPWARRRQACVVLNLHVDHCAAGLARAAGQFRGLIDVAIAFGGSYFLTYHRWATPRQVETCYPEFRQFLALKKAHDPGELFQSDWYRHYRRAFGRRAPEQVTRQPEPVPAC